MHANIDPAFSETDSLSLSLSSHTVFPNLVKKINGGLHMVILFFIFIAIGFALVSLAFCIYNARKVPYQSMKGPLGLYLWNFIAGKSMPHMKYNIV